MPVPIQRLMVGIWNRHLLGWRHGVKVRREVKIAIIPNRDVTAIARYIEDASAHPARLLHVCGHEVVIAPCQEKNKRVVVQLIEHLKRIGTIRPRAIALSQRFC
jgi:hypothetical protein